MTTSAPVISIAILTYRRPDDLAELLPQLAEQAPVVESDLGVSVELLVVDNDPEEGATRAGRGIRRASDALRG